MASTVLADCKRVAQGSNVHSTTTPWRRQLLVNCKSGTCWHPTRRTTARRAVWARQDHKRRYLYTRMRPERWSVLVARLHADICHHSPRQGYIGFPEFRQLRTEHLLGASADSARRRSRTGNYIKLGNTPHLFWHSPVLPGNFPAGKNQPHTESDRDVRGSAHCTLVYSPRCCT